jgi:hypothetical protein
MPCTTPTATSFDLVLYLLLVVSYLSIDYSLVNVR